MLNAKELHEEYGPMIDLFLKERCVDGSSVRALLDELSCANKRDLLQMMKEETGK